jgi:hypothetical protein
MMWFQDTAISTVICQCIHLWFHIFGMADMHICAYAHTHTQYTSSQVYVAKKLPVLLSVSLTKHMEQTIIKINSSNILYYSYRAFLVYHTSL